MSTHKNFDKICCVVLALTLILTMLFMNAKNFGIHKASTVMGYEKTLFDTSKVHTINIIMDDWDEFIENCKSEEYYNCNVVIDNEAYKNVAIRGKGNTSLTQVESYGNNRYSFKIEFDRYDSTNTYYGLDKLCLNNIIQDNTYMKDYLTYQMMRKMGVASPLCSYVYITVNNEDWGLYLAVEGVEESFLQRNYGNDYGELYKPDSTMNMGGDRSNNEEFKTDKFKNDSESESTNDNNISDSQSQNVNNGNGRFPQMPDETDKETSNSNDQNPNDMQNGQMRGNMHGGGMNKSSDDVLLKYIDDEIERYSNIFDNAKTDITKSDKTRLIESLKKLNNGEELESAVDIDTVIRYFVVHNYVLNFDSYTGSMIHNYYLYENNGQMQMIPWDYNLAFGGFQSMGNSTSLVNYPIDSPVSGGNTEDRPMIAWIFKNDEYTELYHKYFSEFISEYFDSGYFEEMMSDVISIISPYVEKDPTKFCTYEEFETGVSTLTKFCLLRAESINGQLDGIISSSSDTQESAALIDASDININDMGSMNNGNKQGGNMQKPQDNTSNNDMNQFPSPEGENERTDFSPQPPSGDFPGKSSEMGDNSSQNIPDGQMQGGTPPDFANGDNSSAEQGDFNGKLQKPDKNARTNDNDQTKPQTEISASSWILIGISVLVLVLALIFAFTYKRRK